MVDKNYLKKIVCVVYGGGHVNMLLPVIRQLKKIPNIELVILGLTTAGSVLERNKIPYLGFKDLLSLSNSRALEYGKVLVGKKSNSMLVSYDESVAYMGLNFNELVESYGGEEANRLYKKSGRHAFYPINLMTQFLQEISPDLVVSTNSPRAEKAVINAATQLNILSMCMVDLFVYQSVAWIGQYEYATKVCVLSEFVKQQLIEAGRAKNQVVVTGNPVFDSINTYKENISCFISNRRWIGAKKVILWASQVEPEEHPFDKYKRGDALLPRKIEAQLFNILLNHPDWQLVIRPHPSENTEYNNLPGNVEISSKSESLYDLLASVDCVITMTSTIAIEAALMGKYVVTVDLSVFSNDSPYSHMGVSEGVDDLIQLEMVLKNTNVVNEAKLDEVVGCTPKATENVLRVILDLIEVPFEVPGL